MSSGTGGTISGSGQYLKDCYSKYLPHKPSCQVTLVDPPGSALYNKVKYNIAYASQQKERGLERHRYDTLAEGIGLDAMGVKDIYQGFGIETSLSVGAWNGHEMNSTIGNADFLLVFGRIVVLLLY